MKSVLTLLFALSYFWVEIHNIQAEFKFQLSCYGFIISSLCNRSDAKNFGEVQHLEQTVLPQKALHFKCSDGELIVLPWKAPHFKRSDVQQIVFPQKALHFRCPDGELIALPQKDLHFKCSDGEQIALPWNALRFICSDGELIALAQKALHLKCSHEKQIALPRKALRFKRSDDNPKLPGNYKEGEAIGDGDCFFDSVAQGLRRLKTEMDFTAKSLRIVCKRFAQSQLKTDQSWLKEALRNEGQPISVYIQHIEFTAEDVQQKSESVNILGLTIPIWGRSEIEGRIICKEYNVKLHVVEKHFLEGKEIWVDVIVDSEGSRSVDSVDYNEENTLHIINSGDYHFNPILDIKDNQKRSLDPSDYDDEITPEEELIAIIKSQDSEKEKLAKIKRLFGKEPKPDINFQYKGEDTPLHVVVRKNELQVIEWLVKNGARIDIKNNRGRTSLDIAKHLKRNDIVQILQSHIQLSVEEEPAKKERHIEGNKIEDSDQKNQQSEQERHIPRSEKLPFDKDLKLSNDNFKSIIETDIKDIKLNIADKLNFLNRPAYPDVYLLVHFASRVYKEREDGQDLPDKKLPDGWKLLTTAYNQGAINHYFGSAYWNPNKQQIVIAHRGTDPSSTGALWTDLRGILQNNYVPQINSAVTFANKIKTMLNELNKMPNVNLQLSFTGHSLGGWLAQITTFTTKYFTLKAFDGRLFFVKSGEVGYHAHTVAFDSPGSEDILTKIKKDFDARYYKDGNSLSLSHLDITSYLSAPNLVNTCCSHLGTIYRIFIEGLSPERSSWDFAKYTIETHSILKIEEALHPERSNELKAVIDWPLVKEGITKRGFEKLLSLSQGILEAVFKKEIPEGNEYEYFHKLAKYDKKYDPFPDVQKGYCKIRYRVENIDKTHCNTRTFTQPELEFLRDYQKLRNFLTASQLQGLFSSFNNENMVEKVIKVLNTFEVENKKKTVLCQSETELNKLIIYVKNALYFFPDVTTKIKNTQTTKPIWFDVEDLARSFTGRQEKLQEIASTIQEGIVVITGLGGVGKSELALKYAHSHYTHEDSVIWINAETHKTAKDSFHRLHKKLGLKIRDEDGEEKSMELVVEDICTQLNKGKRLFIFDNAEKYSTIKMFLPLRLLDNANKPYVLITSPNNLEWESTRVRKTLSLGDFTDTEATEFVKTTLKIKDDSQNVGIKILVETLHNFPLALEHAVTYIKDANEEFRARGLKFKVNDYLGKYEKEPRKMLSIKSIDSEHTEAIFKVLKITLDKIRDNKEYGQQALDMLNIVSYFMSRNIPEEAFLKELASGDKEKLISVTRLLRKYSILDLEQGTSMLNVHGLVQKIRRLDLQNEQNEGKSLEEETLERALRLLKEHIKASHGNAGSCIPHIISIWRYASKYDDLIKSFIVDSTNNKATISTTYFHLIIEGSSYEVVNTIIKKIGSDNLKQVINAKGKEHVTPLHKAVLRNDAKIAMLVINGGADVNAKKSKAWTALHFAAKNGNLNIVNALLEGGAFVNEKTSSAYRFTPLHLAARNGHKDIIEALLAKNADVNAKTGYKFTALHLAARNGHLDAVQALLKDDQIMIDAETKDKFTPLHLATKSGHLGVVEALLSKNANINVQTKDGFTPLHLAALNGDADIVNKLLESNKIDIDARTTRGNTPLHIAAEKGHLNIVKALIGKDADIDIKNEDDNTASDLAHPEAKDYISSVFKRTKGAAGIEGQLCEIKLAMLFLLKGITDDQITSFHLASNMERADKFDDIVFTYEYGKQKSKITFLQAKHKTDQKSININSLLSDSESGDFSLKKYFISYRKIKEEFSKKRGSIFSGKFEDSDFIIYTNAPFVGADNSIKEKNIHQNDFLRISDLQSKCYQLEFNSNKKERILNLLKDSSDSKRLAKELVQSIFSGKGLDMQKDIFQSYHTALQGKVIEKVEDKLEGKLSDKFLNDDGSLSMEDKEFRRVFLEEARRVFKRQGNDLIQELQNKFIKLSNKFGVIKGSENLELPNDDPVAEDEIKDFLKKFKLFASQPNENDLEKVIKETLKDLYKVEQQDIDSVFSDVEYKVKKWWQNGNNYLGKDNKFFADALRVSINFGVKQPVTLFTGRREEISELHTRIQRSSEKVTVISQMTSISGLGGIGKTELARQYIYENSKDYDNNIIWVNAESEATLIESFSWLAKDKLKINTQDANGNEKDIKSIVEEIYKYFSKRKSLFIFDNAEKNEYLNKFLPLRSLPPDSKRPYILITSRNREWETGIEVMDLNELKLEDAVEFVKKGLRIQDESQDEEVKALVEKLQCFPLAIQQAVAYIEDEKVTGEFSIGHYLEEYKRKTEDLLNSKLFKGIDNDYSKTTFTTWKITIDKIAREKEHGGTALEVLNTIAYLAPESIKREILLELAGHDERKLKSAVRLLVKYSMVNSEEKQRVLSVHRLVQEVTRLELRRQRKEEENLKEVLKLVKTNLKMEHLDHAMSVWNHASKNEELVKEFSELPAQITGKLDDAGRYREACLFGIKALNALESVLIPDHEDNLTLKSNIALAFNNQGKYNEALQIYQEVLDKTKLILDILSTQSNIAWVLDNQGKHDEALQVYQEIYEKRKNILEPDHPDTLKVQDDIALVLHNLGRYSESLQIYEEIYEKSKRILGQDHQSTLKTGNNMALVLEKYGKLDQALQVYQEIYEKRQKVHGENHPFTLLTKNNIAALLGKLGRPEDEILQILQEVYHAQENSLGIDHPETLLTMSNIGISLGILGKYDEALKILEDVYRARKEMLGENHVATLSTKHSAAVVLHRYHKYDEALNIYKEVYDAQKRVLGILHPYTLLTRSNMMEIFAMQGKYEEALNICEEIYEQRKKKLGDDHYDTLTTRSNIAKLLEKQGKHEEALKVFQEVYQKRTQKFGENHPDTRETEDNINRLSQVLRSSGKYETHIAECLPNNRRKREAAGECLFNWEDVDEFNLEKDEKRDLSKVKTDSKRFIDYIKDLPERKRNQLIQLADNVEVTGESQNLVNKLIGNQKVISHLNRVGRISGIAMHGMMAKNVLADFLSGDYQGVAINVGFIAGGQGFAKVAEAASLKGLTLASKGKVFLGRSLRAASPFLARGTSAFVIYDLINQAKSFKNGTEEALAGMVGDSIYIGVDAAEIGIEIAEAFEVLEGVSSVTGPIGAAVGAVVFVGTDIYMAVKRVDKIDKIIHLTSRERFVEGLRAFIGMKPEERIQELLQEKEMSNSLVKQGFDYLKQHSDIQNYVFPTGKSVVDSCRKVPYKTSVCASGGFGGGCFRARTVIRYAEECTTKVQIDLHSIVLLDRKRAHVKWSRARPDDPSGGKLFCLPQGNDELAPSYGSYLCENAIGITDLSAKTANRTLINLGEGTDHAKGFTDSPNIFVVNNGSKTYFGGNEDDMFILQGSPTRGNFYGGGGINTLDLTSFAPEELSIDVKLHIGQVEDYYQKNFFRMSGINKFLGRKDKADQVFITCDRDTNDIKFVDGQSGSERFVDHIVVHDKDCAYEMQVVVRPNTVIYNRALKGDFHYIVPYALGSAKVDFIYAAEVLSINNTFAFEYELDHIKNIDIRNINVLNKTSHVITFNFSPMSDKEFNITISGASNPSYRLGNDTEIKVGNRGNLYVLENTNKSVDEVIRDYSFIANRLNKMSFFIHSLLSNETVVIGSGNYEVIHNDPLRKSHLVGKGGENVYVIDSKVPLPDVVIYDLDVQNSVDTIDLRNLVQQARGEFSNKDSCKLQVLKSANDLLLTATGKINVAGRCDYFTVNLKDGVNWYNKIHVITGNVPMRISRDNNEWSLKPQALIFEKDKEVIVVTSEDVEENTELITPRRAGNYTFLRDRSSDLIITNAFNTQDDLCTIVLSKFYETPKMKTLSIKFADKQLVLKDNQELISIARNVDIVKREHEDLVYNDVFNRFKH